MSVSKMIFTGTFPADASAFHAETDSLNGLAGCDTVTVFDSPGSSENQLSE